MSLKLFYTNSVGFDKPQVDPFSSLGGYISSTELPNALLGNLFSDISKLTIQQNKAEIRVIAIKNVAGSAKVNLNCYFTYPNDGAMPTSANTNDCDYEIGFAAPTVDDCGDLMTEKLQNIYASPYNVTLVANKVGSSNALSLGTLDADNYLCIFIRRKLKPVVDLTDDQMMAILNGTKILPTIEDIQLTFAWD